jgi:protein SCO1
MVKMPEKRKNGLQNGLIIGLSMVSLLITVLIIVIAARELTNTSTPESSSMLTDFDGSTRIDPPRPMPDFTLTNQHGDEVQLSDLDGKPSLLFFGFTHCPDFCPTTMTDFKAIQRDLGDKGDEVNFVFISVDGERDTPQVLADFFRVRQIDDFIGLTGTPDKVRRIGADYGVQFEYTEKDASGSYDVSHTPSVFLLDKDGTWRMKYDFGTEISVIVEDLKEILQR